MVDLDVSSHLRRRIPSLHWRRTFSNLKLRADLCLLCAVRPILVCLYSLSLNQSCDHHNQRNLKKKIITLVKADSSTFSCMTMCQKCENEFGFGALQAMKV